MRKSEYFVPAIFHHGRLRPAAIKLLNLLLAVVIGLGSVARAAPHDAHDSTSGSVSLPGPSASQPPLDVKFEVKTIDASEASEELNKALRESSDMTIVSTDEDTVIEDVAVESRSHKRGRLFLVPFGKAVDASKHVAGGVNEALFKSGHYFVNALKKDKIGFGIATFTLSNEVVRWVHVSSASTFMISANIIYAVLWTAMFIDKDTWSKATRPIQQTYRKLFRLSQVIPETPTAMDTAIKYLSGTTLSMFLNSGRVAIVAIDQMAKQTFDPLQLTMPFVMGLVMTAAGFSWSELVGAIDENESPRAKKIVRFVMNSRSVVLSYLASSAMLLNYAEYGMSPWIAVTMSGLTGLVLYTNMKKLVPFLERRKLRQCQGLFAGA